MNSTPTQTIETQILCDRAAGLLDEICTLESRASAVAAGGIAYVGDNQNGLTERLMFEVIEETLSNTSLHNALHAVLIEMTNRLQQTATI